MNVNKKVLIAAVSAVVILCVLCVWYVLSSDVWKGALPVGGVIKTPVSGVLSDRANQKTEYVLEILKLEDLEKESLKNWVSESAAKKVSESSYFTLYNNGSEAFDMYLFLPSAGKVMGGVSLSNFKAEESDSTLLIYVDTAGKAKAAKKNSDMILHVYAKSAENTTAKSERLFIDEKMYNCISSTFMVLK